MQSSRDSSFWHALAVAFGDGLAFGVGVKLTQAARRQRSTQHSNTPQEKLDYKRIGRSEDAQTGSNRFDQKALEATISALEARLHEHSAEVERRIADLDARIAIELRSLDRQDRAIAKQFSEECAEFQQHMVRLHREFGGAVARIVEEQVVAQVEGNAAALESRLAAAMTVRMGSLEKRLLAQVEQRDREIAELRERLADTDANVRELILGIGRICRQAADRITAPADEVAAASIRTAKAETTLGSAGLAPCATEPRYGRGRVVS